MVKISQRKMDILQSIADKIDTEKYYSYQVQKRKDGFYLMPDEARWFGDKGEFMGETFEQAKVNIAEFTLNLT
jgi:hypothetical protein